MPAPWWQGIAPGSQCLEQREGSFNVPTLWMHYHALEPIEAGTHMNTATGVSSLLISVDPIGNGSPALRESMASWVWRLAQANGFLFTSDLLRSARVKVRDLSRLDLGPNGPIAAATFAEMAMLPIEEISALTLTATLQHMGVEESPKGHPWVLSSARLARKRHGAMHAVCPSCLREDEIPYWRQCWRLATAVRCAQHHHALIDQCPACAAPIVLTHRRTMPLELCEFCGEAYGDHHDRSYRIARSNWIDTVPLAIQAKQLPMAVADPLLWWIGLRTLLFVLCIPRHARRLAIADIPSTFLSTLRVIAGTPRLEFAQHPITIRHSLLRLAAWLTESWPHRFVATMKAMGLGAAEFSIMELRRPFWLQSAVDQYLVKKRYQVSSDELRSAQATLSNRQKPISKISLKRQLGITEAKALDALLPERLKMLSDDTLQQVIAMLDADIESTASAREAQSSALRDACCIAASAWLGVSFIKVCELDVAAGLALNRTWHAIAQQESPNYPLAASPHVALATVFCRWGDQYAQGVRHRFCRYGQAPAQYFVTRFGRPYGGFNLAARFADLLRRAGVTDWGAGARLLVKNGLADRPTSLKSATKDGDLI